MARRAGKINGGGASTHKMAMRKNARRRAQPSNCPRQRLFSGKLKALPE
jgi:hypothetical protein